MLQNISIVLSQRQPTSQQTTELDDIAQGCRSVLEELEDTLNSYERLASSAKGLGGKFRRLLERLKWDQDLRRSPKNTRASASIACGFSGRGLDDTHAAV